MGLRRTGAEASAVNDRLRLLGLQTDIELQVVNVTIESLRGRRNLLVRIPLLEARIR